jgi:hypothetical protein
VVVVGVVVASLCLVGACIVVDEDDDDLETILRVRRLASRRGAIVRRRTRFVLLPISLPGVEQQENFNQIFIRPWISQFPDSAPCPRRYCYCYCSACYDHLSTIVPGVPRGIQPP